MITIHTYILYNVHTYIVIVLLYCTLPQLIICRAPAASYQGERSVYRQRVLPRDPVERGAVWNRSQPAQEPTLRIRGRRS